MDSQRIKQARLKRRRGRVRRKVVGTAERPRLVVTRSLKHMSAQIVDDSTGRTLAAVSTMQAKVRGTQERTGGVAAAQLLGKAVAEAALSEGVKSVCFDRGGRKYHGRVKAAADAARKAGLAF